MFGDDADWLKKLIASALRSCSGCKEYRGNRPNYFPENDSYFVKRSCQYRKTGNKAES
jgi:hypothetical protein